MRSRLFFSFFLGLLSFAIATSGLAQTIYSARESQIPITIGTGISSFNLDYGLGRRMEGITAWLDWSPSIAPGFLRGVGLEIEGRDINFGRPSSLPRMRQDTATGGVVYSFPYRHRVHPYGKYLVGVGSIDFPSRNTYTHDTRAISAPGAGVEVKVFQGIRVRGDYEYQFWPRLFGPHTLNPNGFTISTAYDFHHSAR